MLGALIAPEFGVLEPLGVLHEWEMLKLLTLVNSFICPRVIFVFEVHLQHPVPWALLGFASHNMHLLGPPLSTPLIYRGFFTTCIY